MAGETLGAVIRRLGRAGVLQGDLAQTDGQLLERIARRRDEPAFAALLARHGPMVLGVCRRLLHDSQNAEDAFQAVFLVLARKAAAIQRQALIGPWLYSVAWRVAVRLRGRTTRRREREDSAADLNALPASDPACSDVRWVVHEEVERLPDVYRSAVVLCFLEGRTNEEAARLLGRPVGTVKSRLTRARELLHTRLTRRGMALAGSGVAVALKAKAAPASAALADATVRAAVPFAAGEAVGVFGAARAVALSQGVLQTMLLTKAKITAAVALAVLLCGAFGGLAYRAWAGQPGPGPKAVVGSEVKPMLAERSAPKDDQEAIQGTWRVASIVVNGNEWDDAEGRKQKTALWTITADKMTVSIDAVRRHEQGHFAYKLDSTQTPRVLDVAPWDVQVAVRGENIPKVYSLEGDTLLICNGVAPNRDRPKEVASKEGSQTVLYTLKRVVVEKEKPTENADAEGIQGTWIAVSAEAEGEKALAEAIKDFQLVITADKLVFNPRGENRASSYKLDPAKSPKVIEVTPQDGPAKGKTMRGLYELDGDRLKLCIQNGNGKEPTEFATKPGSGLRLLILKRQPTEKPKEDKEALQGTWRVIAVETEGRKRDDDQARYLKSQKWVFNGDKMVVNIVEPGDSEQEREYAVELDPEKTPKAIDFVYGQDAVTAKVKKAVYSLDGDVLKICQGMMGPEVKQWDQLLGRRPRGFEVKDLLGPARPLAVATKEGSETTLITLERLK